MARNTPRKRCVWGPGSTLPRERTATDKTIGRPSSPKNVLACTQNPPSKRFSAFKKHLLSRSGSKSGQNDLKRPPNLPIDGIDGIDGGAGGRQDFFVSGCLVAVVTRCDSDWFVTQNNSHEGRFLAPQPTRERRIDKTVGRPSSPKNALACTQNPPFEAFFGR